MSTPEVVNIYEAKTRLSALLAEVEAGGSVVIARAGRPVARLVPFQSRRRPPRVPGLMRGRIRIIGDLDAADREIAADFDEASDQAWPS
jgi:prevent-host-death family protein